jgi:hypothetical protein
MANPNKYRVILNCQQRETLEQISHNGSGPAKRIIHARILLMSDAHHPEGRYTDEQIARALSINVNTVRRIRKAFVVRGWGPALERKQRLTGPTPPKLDGHGEATLVAICCSSPPSGRVCWTLSLLRQELVNRHIVTAISRETVRTTLKKTDCNRGAKSVSAFPSRRRPVSWHRWNKCWTFTRSPRRSKNRW